MRSQNSWGFLVIYCSRTYKHISTNSLIFMKINEVTEFVGFSSNILPQLDKVTDFHICSLILMRYVCALVFDLKPILVNRIFLTKQTVAHGIQLPLEYVGYRFAEAGQGSLLNKNSLIRNLKIVTGIFIATPGSSFRIGTLLNLIL